MDLPARSTFQFFGLDFLVDTHLHAWLMEVNATPSMKAGPMKAGASMKAGPMKAGAWPPGLLVLSTSGLGRSCAAGMI